MSLVPATASAAPATARVFRKKTGHWTRGWLCTLMRRAVDACPESPLKKRKQVAFHALRHSFASFLAMDARTRKLQEVLAPQRPEPYGSMFASR